MASPPGAPGDDPPGDAHAARSSAQLRALYAHATVGLCLLDAELRYVSINERLAAMHGLPAADHLGRRVREVVPQLADSVEPLARHVLDTGRAMLNMEIPRARAVGSGLERAWLASYCPVVDEGGRRIGVSVLVQDVTERRRTEHALDESQARNQAILSALPDMMFLMTTDGVYLDAHVRDERELLVPPSQFIGRSLFDVLPPDLSRQFAASFEEVARGGSPVVEYSLVTDGQRRHYEARLVRCGAAEVLSIVRNVTESKRVQLQAQADRLELARVSRVTLLGELAAALAHELSQPLAGILSNAQAARRLLAGARVDLAETEATLGDIIEDSKRAGEVLRRLRSWLRRDAPARQALDLNPVVEEVRHLVRSELILRQVPLVTELASELPPVMADRVQLQQVILNLVLNAAEAMIEQPPGERQLVIQTSGLDGEVQVAVRDRGTGIAPEHESQLFDPFFSTKATGLGMGLRICSSLVEAQGGRIWARNNADRGATFFFTLPVAPGEP